MAIAAIRDPRIAQGFSALADALFPDPRRGAAMEAQMAQAAAANALARQRQVETRGLTMQNEAMTALNARLSDPNTLRSPEGIAAVLAELPVIPGGLQYGPGFVTGAETLINPMGRTEDEFSRVLAGTGVQTFPNTPSGQSRALEGDLAEQALRNEGLMERTLAGGGANGAQALVVNASTDRALQEGALARLMAEYEIDSDKGVTITPELQEVFDQRLTENFRITRSIPLAVRKTLQEIPIDAERQDWGVPIFSTRKFEFGLGDGPLPIETPAAPQAPQAPAAGAQVEFQPGDEVPDGVVIRWNGEMFIASGGEWVPYDG